MKINHSKQMIDPRSQLRVHWNELIMILTIISTFLTPFRLGFKDKTLIDDQSMAILNTIMDIIFMIDIGLNLRTGIYHSEFELIEYDPQVVRKKYFRGWFIWDVLAAIPTELVFYIVKSDNSYFGLTALFKTLRLLKFARKQSAFQFLDSYRHTSTYKLIQLLFVIICCIHWIGTCNRKYNGSTACLPVYPSASLYM